MANSFAYIALIAAPFLVLRYYRRFRPAVACSAFFVGALMFLPHGTGLKIPGIPELNKESLVLVALLIASRRWSSERWRAATLDPGTRVVIAILLVAGVVTVILNRDPLVYGSVTIPGHVPYDTVSSVLRDLLVYVLPFLLGNAICRTPGDLRSFLYVMAMAGLVYALPALFEIRFSPRLHEDLYGYAQNQFGKNIRWGGYRPLLFMQSGIAVGVFMSVAALSGATLQRARLWTTRGRAVAVTVALLALVVLCKSTAAIIYAIIFVPLVLFAAPWILRAMLLITLLVTLCYPVMRMTGLDPTDSLVDFGMWLDEDRGGSIQYRFLNEDEAMDHVSERLFFGWGGYDRNRVFDDAGEMKTIFDAFYIIAASERGIVGAACIFALIAIPIFKLLAFLPHIRSPQHQTLALGVGYVLLVRLLDLMQNGFYTSLPLLFAGALSGALPGLTERNGRGSASATG